MVDEAILRLNRDSVRIPRGLPRGIFNRLKRSPEGFLQRS